MIWLSVLVLACGEKVDPALGALGGGGADDSAVSTLDTGEKDTAHPDSGAIDPACDDCAPSAISATLEFSDESFTVDLHRTRNNPLRGFMTSYLWGAPYTDFPDQMEFLYIPLSELWGEAGETLEAGLEPHLVAAEGRSHHAVLRVFVDYPSRPSGLPGYLDGVVSCMPYADHGGGCSPDYEHPALQDAMFGLIAALGSRYDGDPRLGFVQLGLLGFWGEWHTWPHSDWFPSEATQDAILDAYDEAFSVTQLQLRYPVSSSVTRRIGFHDDSFAHSTLGDVDWFFLPRLEAAGAAERWQEVAIGGELRPELQSSVFADDYVLGESAQDVGECIEQTHASYLLNYYAFNGDGVGYLGGDRDRAELAALSMGYRFELTGARLEASGLLDGELELSLEFDLAQTGVAPFYYPLFLSVKSAALGEPRVSEDDLRGLMPGESRTLRLELGRVSASILDEPITVGFESEILQAGQAIVFATLTPWSDAAGGTHLQWELGCASDVGPLALGESAGRSVDGCDCVCDVDGRLWTCRGESCE